MYRAGPTAEISADPGCRLFDSASGRDPRQGLIAAGQNTVGMALDLTLRKAVDIPVAGGKIVDIAPAITADAPQDDIGGRLIVVGFIETHIHLDKSCILDRCKSEQGTLAEAIAEVARAKRAFSEDDVCERARSTLEKAILHGTMRMRTHVEVDPPIGLKGFHAQRLKNDHR